MKTKNFALIILLSSFLASHNSPTTCKTLMAVAVKKLGDSVVTSHEMFPFRLKSTFRNVTWVAFDTDNCCSDKKKHKQKNQLLSFSLFFDAAVKCGLIKKY